MKSPVAVGEIIYFLHSLRQGYTYYISRFAPAYATLAFLLSKRRNIAAPAKLFAIRHFSRQLYSFAAAARRHMLTTSPWLQRVVMRMTFHARTTLAQEPSMMKLSPPPRHRHDGRLYEHDYIGHWLHHGSSRAAGHDRKGLPASARPSREACSPRRRKA